MIYAAVVLPILIPIIGILLTTHTSHLDYVESICVMFLYALLTAIAIATQLIVTAIKENK